MTKYLIIFVFFTTLAKAQETDHRSNDLLDSLTLSIFIDLGLESSVPLSTRNQKELSRMFSAVDTMNSIECSSMCNSFNAQRVSYDSSRVPKEISRMYARASEYINKDKLHDALKLFYAALTYKRDFIEREKERIISYYQRSKELYKLNKTDSLRRYVRIFEDENPLSPAYRIVNDEYRMKEYYASIKVELEKKEHKMLYDREHADYFDKLFSIEVGPAININDQMNSPKMRVTDYISQSDTIFRPVALNGSQQTYVSFYPTITLSYNVGNAINLYIGFSYWNIMLQRLGKSHPLFNDIVFFDSDSLRVEYYQYTLSGRYYSRTNVGVRPFVDVGIGFNVNKSEEKKLLAVYQFTYYALKQHNTTPFISLGGGMEYVPNRDSYVFFGIRIGANFFLRAFDYSSNISANILATVNFVVI